MRWLKRRFTHSPWLNIDRAMSGSLAKQIRLVLLIIFVLFVVFWACMHFHQMTFVDTGNNLISKPLMLLYLFVDSNAFGSLVAYNENKHVDGFSLGIAMVIFLSGMIIFNGLLISILTNWYLKRVENYKCGKTSYLWSRHFVILGYDEIVPSVIQRIFKENSIKASGLQRLFGESKKPYILLQSSLPCDVIWEKLQRSAAYNDKDEKDHIILSHGHRISESDLNKLNLSFAKRIFVIGDRDKSTHDSMNIESLRVIYKVLKKQKQSYIDVENITCVVEDDDTYLSLQYLNMFDVFKEMYVKLVFYNFYTEWVKTIFFSNTYGDTIKIGNEEYNRDYPVINQSSITYNDDQIIHLVVIGLNSFGVSIGVEAAKIIHLPNFVRDSNLKTRITFIDIKADKEMQFFRTRYNSFFEIQTCRYIDTFNDTEEVISPSSANNAVKDYLDISYEFIKGDVFSSKIKKMINDWALESNPLSFFITFRDQQKGLSLALHLPSVVYNTENINIFVRQTRSDAFVTLHRYASKPFKNLYPFGMTDVYCDISKHEEIIRVTKLLKYFDFDSDVMNDLLTEDFDKSSWDAIMKKADVLSEQLSFMDNADENRYLYKAYSIKWWEYSLKKKDKVDSPAMINDFIDAEIDYYLQTEHNRKNVLLLLLGTRIAPKYFEDYYRSIGKSEIRKSTHTIEPYDKEKVSENDRKAIKLIPQMIRTSYVSTKSIVQTLHPNTQTVENGELKSEWELDKENGFSELEFDPNSGEFNQNFKNKRLKKCVTPQYDYLYDSENGTLKKTPKNLSAKIFEYFKTPKTLVFDENNGEFVEVPRNIFIRLYYKIFRKNKA